MEICQVSAILSLFVQDYPDLLDQVGFYLLVLLHPFNFANQDILFDTRLTKKPQTSIGC